MKRRSPYAPLLSLSGPGLKVQSNVDLMPKTTMKMNAVADVFATVDQPYELKRLFETIRQMEVPSFLLGGGANTLFASTRFEGVVVKLGPTGFGKLEWLGGNLIRAGAAVNLPRLIKYSHDCRLMGLEFLTKVPGTVGGALAMNAGAGKWGLCDYVERVMVMTRSGFICCVDRNEFQYSYRHSDLRDVIVLEADFRLEPLNQKIASEAEEEFKAKKKGQPYHLPSCGCIFKNPKDPVTGLPVSAGKLIDEAQLKGYKIRAAQVSNEHGNFLVNTDNSSGEDFLALISLVRDLVWQRRGIELEMEVQIVGGPLNSVVLAG